MGLPEIDGLWDYADPAGSEQRFRETLPAAAESEDRGYHVELLTQIARAVCLQRRFDDAYAVLDDADTLVPRPVPDDLRRARVRCLLERGRVDNDTERTAEAMKRFDEALRLAEDAGEVLLAADALHMLAYVARGDECLRWHRVAIEFCARQEGERFRRWLVTLYTNQADEYERRGDHALGLESVGSALAIAEDLGWEQRIAGTQVFLARLHRLSGDAQLARPLLERVIETGLARGYAYEEFAECLVLEGRAEEAREHFRRAYELLSKDPWFPPGEVERLERLRRLAEGT